MDDGLRELLGVEVVEAEADAALVEMVADDRHLNPHGSVHGGALATLADSAMAAAVCRDDTDDQAPVTIEMKVTYLEPGSAGRLRAEARVRRRGKRIIIAEADIFGADGTAIAHATGTFTSL